MGSMMISTQSTGSVTWRGTACDTGTSSRSVTKAPGTGSRVAMTRGLDGSVSSWLGSLQVGVSREGVLVFLSFFLLDICDSILLLLCSFHFSLIVFILFFHFLKFIHALVK